ncbi:MAG: ribonuclease J [Candidatus Magasanikbacteria bacterium]|jgi:ribonuclease J|nr:ribonuclease J [Candidatus Magasanikbacteria bacterium]MBT4315127.1 ribonuclease J [Candidatus Magasanikbacteria bacterium]MBT4547417.1 ribonuclease J [Candidatus Magasanikbacteria bacterium]MBT6819342.1 ribonuclease J [Candidatus Magasanikbacteria bacterium]
MNTKNKSALPARQTGGGGKPATSGQNKRSFGNHSSVKTTQKPKQQSGKQPGKQGGKHYKKFSHANKTGKSSPINRSPNLRIIPIGGCEEVGRNMTVFEFKDDIIILDMGIQFPEEDMPGIDYIVPNTRYLIGKEKNIRGVIFSHGHLDHIGAAPILLEKLGNPKILGRDLTLALIKHKQEDYKKGTSKNLKTMQIKSIKDVVRLGKFTIKFFQVEHSIMDAVGVIIETPNGTVIHPGDWTLERDESGKPTVDYSDLQKLKKPTVLMLESLGSLHTKRSGSYKEMYNNLFNILKDAEGRVIIGTFSSQVERIKWVIDAAQQLGKKVALDGYSMKMNIEMAQELGYVKLKKGLLIDIKKIKSLPDKSVIVICTGAQGEEKAVLSRIVAKQHRHVQLKKADTVIFSSSVIPGNERTIQRLKDNIYRQSDHVIHGEIMDVHVSGHATREDIWEVIDQVKPTYFIPVYANHYFLKEAKNLAISNGFDKNKIFVPDNGSIIEVNTKTAKMLDKKVPSDYVFVDGLGVTDTQNIVLRDRQVLAEDGMVVVIATVDTKTGKLIQNPDIISRGFVFLKENKKLIEDMRHKVKKMVTESDPKTWADTNQIRNDIRDKVGQFLFTKTEKRPMILPVVIEV